MMHFSTVDVYMDLFGFRVTGMLERRVALLLGLCQTMLPAATHGCTELTMYYEHFRLKLGEGIATFELCSKLVRGCLRIEQQRLSWNTLG